MHTRFLETMVEITPLLSVALFSERTAGKMFYQERILPVVSRSTQAFDDALAAWDHPPMEVRLLFLAVFGIHFAVALDADMRDVAVDVEATAAELTAFIVRGVGGGAS